MVRSKPLELLTNQLSSYLWILLYRKNFFFNFILQRLISFFNKFMWLSKKNNLHQKRLVKSLVKAVRLSRVFVVLQLIQDKLFFFLFK